MNLAQVRDGLSNTLAFSEKPIGSGADGNYDPVPCLGRVQAVLPLQEIGLPIVGSTLVLIFHKPI